MRKRIYKMVPLIVLFRIIALGCGEWKTAVESNASIPYLKVQSWSKMTIHQHMRIGEAVIPARIYFDNTGSMEGLHPMKISDVNRNFPLWGIQRFLYDNVWH